jgi:hypothetical protein
MTAANEIDAAVILEEHARRFAASKTHAFRKKRRSVVRAPVGVFDRVWLCTTSGRNRRNRAPTSSIVPEALLLTHQRDHPRRACGRRSDMNDLQRLSGGHQ